jgi:hypothetical protein
MDGFFLYCPAGDGEGFQQERDSVFRVLLQQTEVLRQNDCILELKEPLSLFDEDFSICCTFCKVFKGPR